MQKVAAMITVNAFDRLKKTIVYVHVTCRLNVRWMAAL